MAPNRVPALHLNTETRILRANLEQNQFAIGYLCQLLYTHRHRRERGRRERVVVQDYGKRVHRPHHLRVQGGSKCHEKTTGRGLNY